MCCVMLEIGDLRGGCDVGRPVAADPGVDLDFAPHLSTEQLINRDT
jgi:hypothetical protein